MSIISIIIPAYNEGSRLPAYLSKILAYIEPQDISYEIIVVDDGSIDATAEIVTKITEANSCVKLIQLPHNQGKGYAVRTGMLQASGTLRLFADADGATPITELKQLRKAIDTGADIAIASRALRSDSCKVQARLHRKVIGSVFNFIVRTIAVRGLSDTQCGFKLFTAESATAVFSLQSINDFGFDVEILFLGNKKGYRIVEVPVNWTEVEGSKVKLLSDSFRMFADILKVRLNELRGVYR